MTFRIAPAILPPATPIDPPVTLDLIKEKEHRILGMIQDYEKYPQDLGKRAEQLEELHAKISILQVACHSLRAECDKTINNLSFWRESREIIKFYFVRTRNCLSGLFGQGKYGEIYSHIEGTNTRLTNRIEQLVRGEIRSLQNHQSKKCMESLQVARIYKVLELLTTESAPLQNEVLEKFGKSMLKEKAYTVAFTIYSKIFNDYSHKNQFRLDWIYILMGLERYVEAQQEIIRFRETILRDKNEAYDPPNTEKLELTLWQLEAECLTGLEHYADATKILRHHIQESSPDDTLKQKIILYTLKGELKEQLTEEIPGENLRFFLTRSKHMFGMKQEFLENAWGKETLIIDFEFWLFALFSQKLLHENRDFVAYIKDELQAIINSKKISVETILKTVEKFFTDIRQSYQAFEESFNDLIQGGAATLSTLEETRQAILEARKKQISNTLEGDLSINGSAGLQRKRAIFQELLKFLLAQEKFKAPEVQIRLLAFLGQIDQQKHSVSVCSDTILKVQQKLAQTPTLFLLLAPSATPPTALPSL